MNLQQKEMVENVTLVCRLCSSEQGHLEDIFKYKDLNVWIFDFLAIVISKDDKISLSICTSCWRRICGFREYKLRCYEVQKFLLRKSIAVIAVEESKEETIPNEELQQHTVVVDEEQQPTKANEPVVTKRSHSSRQENDSSSKKVTCATCGKQVFQYHLEGHQNRHKGLRPFKCERGCENVDFNCRYYRQSHYRNIHAGKQHECDVCLKTFQNKACLYYHIKGVHAPKTFACPVCNKAFSTSSRLIAHKKLHDTRERKYRCSLCNLSFFTKYILEIHMKTHRRKIVRGQKENLVDAVQALADPEQRMLDDTPLAIEEDKFGEKEMEIESEQSNDEKDDSMPDEEKELCSICDKIFPKVRMEGHQNWHQGLRPFECQRGCKDVDFHCQQKRLQHYRKVHDRHECDICHNIFRSKKTLRTHMQGVHAPKSFECSACKQMFTTAERLKIHTKLVHDREKNHACPNCSKLFCFKYELNRHMKSHCNKVFVMEKLVKLEPGPSSEQFQNVSSSMAMEEDSFEVEETTIEPKLGTEQPINVRTTAKKLEYKKYSKKLLDVTKGDHERQHHYREVHEKNECDICHKTFQCKQSLRSHKRSVHGTKAFTCFCGNAYTIKSQLQRHKDQVHEGVKDQCCPICNKAFARKFGLTRHMEIHKKDKQDEEPAELVDLFEAGEVKIEKRDDDLNSEANSVNVT